jgi:glucose-6-phosphate dehydrogenase assembly protein OpcA
VTPASPAHARSATVVVVGASERLEEAARALSGEDEAGSLRVVLITTESQPAPPVDADGDVVSIGGLRPQYVNNAIAGVRLSSLPTMVWWRGGLPEGLDGVATLADRVVLDVEDPAPLWPRLPALFDQTGFTDLRWTRLTRWRSAMAHFFDLPQVRDAAPDFDRLEICGGDHPQCSLFAGWLDASLGWRGRIKPRIVRGRQPLESITLGGRRADLILRRIPASTCLETEVQLEKQVLTSRVVSLGDQSLRTLMSEEMRVRSRDVAFEKAVQSALST